MVYKKDFKSIAEKEIRKLGEPKCQGQASENMRGRIELCEIPLSSYRAFSKQNSVCMESIKFLW